MNTTALGSKLVGSRIYLGIGHYDNNNNDVRGVLYNSYYMKTTTIII